MRNHTEGLAIRLMKEISDDIEKAHYLNAAHKAAELQLTLLRLLSDALKNPSR